MKVSELSKAKLDYWVAKAVGLYPKYDKHSGLCRAAKINQGHYPIFTPSPDWSIGGKLIDEYDIWLSSYEGEDGRKVHVASVPPHINEAIQEGSTKLVAACRAIIVSVYGEEVEE